jgi:hypothetical protein
LNDQKRFGRYVIERELGRGAMGAVHLAKDPLIEREVAIKTLLPDLPGEVMAEVRERFLREARSAGRLNHPGIVTIFDVGEQDGVAYIAMEVLEGRSLQEMLREPERLPLTSVVNIAAQVADALDHAQRFGIVHRDVKPANIMVSATGRAKLTDFGVAHVPSSSMTQTGAVLGSPKYMSPEQVTGQPLDPRSDIFSLGAVLYEMLVRRTPFERQGDTNVWALLHRIAGEPHQPATTFDRGLPEVFNRILDRALAKSPAQRYQRAGDLANELRNTRLAGAFGTVALGAEERRSGATTPVASTAALDATRLMEDLDHFSQVFEEQAAEERRRAVEEQERLRRAHEKTQVIASPKPAPAAPARKPSALELLKQQAAARPAVPDERAKKTESNKHIDARLRAAFQYLAQFGAMLREAHPVSKRRFGLVYFGEASGLSLTDGSADYRFRRLGHEERFDYVVFKLKVAHLQPQKLEVSGDQLPKVRQRLDAMGVRYQPAQERKNDFGMVVHAKLMVIGPFPCEIVVRGDYDQPGFVFEMENVGRLGAARFRLAPDELTDETLDELGTWLLGADDAFARFVTRK